jgi:hypothetical protein
MTVSRLAFVVTLVALLWRLVVVPLLQNELVGLCEWLARWLVHRAVQRLPAQKQARWATSWPAPSWCCCSPAPWAAARERCSCR